MIAPLNILMNLVFEFLLIVVYVKTVLAGQFVYHAFMENSYKINQ